MATKNPAGYWAEVIVAMVLGILAIASYSWQILGPAPASWRETALFNVLQFLLTVAFGWFSTRAVSRSEFEASLKRFAVSAYRRTRDNEQMTRRLQTRVTTLREARLALGTECADLDVIAAVIDDNIQVVSSSIADWSDVLGDELIAIEKVRVLEAERSAISSQPTNSLSAEVSKTIEAIDKRISILVQKLPAGLQFDVARQERSQAEKAHAEEWLREMHERASGLTLEVISGPLYSEDFDADSLKGGDQVWVSRASGAQMNVYGSDGTLIGRALNMSPMAYDHFSETFFACYGDAPVPATFLEIIGRRTSDGETQKWFSVRILRTPKPRLAKPRSEAASLR